MAYKIQQRLESLIEISDIAQELHLGVDADSVMRPIS